MESTNSEGGKATSTDAGGVSTLPSVYSSGLPATGEPASTAPSPQSTGIVDWEFIRSVDGILKVIEIVRFYTCLLCAKLRIKRMRTPLAIAVRK